jgi:hypothetical protein
VSLSTEDADQFYRLMWGLQLFVGKKHYLVPEGQTLPEYATLGMNAKIKARDVLWEHPGLIDRYVTENPDRLSPDEIAMVQRWKRFVAGTQPSRLRHWECCAPARERRNPPPRIRKTWTICGAWDDASRRR